MASGHVWILASIQWTFWGLVEVFVSEGKRIVILEDKVAGVNLPADLRKS